MWYFYLFNVSFFFLSLDYWITNICAPLCCISHLHRVQILVLWEREKNTMLLLVFWQFQLEGQFLLTLSRLWRKKCNLLISTKVYVWSVHLFTHRYTKNVELSRLPRNNFFCCSNLDVFCGFSTLSNQCRCMMPQMAGSAGGPRSSCMKHRREIQMRSQVM